MLAFHTYLSKVHNSQIKFCFVWPTVFRWFIRKHIRQRKEPSTHNFRLISKYAILLKLNNVLHFKHHSNISNGLLLLLPFLLLKNRIQFINFVCCRQLKHLQQLIFFCKHIALNKKQPKCLFEWMMLLLIYRIKLAHINSTKKDEFCWFIHNKTKWFSNWKNPYYLLNSMSSWLQWSLLKHTCLSVGAVLLHSKKDPITLVSNLNFICLVFQWIYCLFFCIHIFLELNFHLKNDHDLEVEVQVIYKLSIELYITTIPQCWYHTKWEHFCSDSRRFRQTLACVFFSRDRWMQTILTWCGMVNLYSYLNLVIHRISQNY